MFQRWWYAQKFDRKLGIIIGLMGSLIILQLFVLIFSMSILSTTRILVGGEGVWSKAQKDATNSLMMYLITKDEDHYRNFFDLMAIPEGNRLARLELIKENFDYDFVVKTLISVGTHPEDVPTSITNIRRLQKISEMSDALKEWEKGDQAIGELIALAKQIHQDYQTRSYDENEVQENLEKISQLNKKFTQMEHNFSNSLGELGRALEGFITVALLAAVLTVISIGFILMRSFNSSVRSSIQNLRSGIDRVKKGHFNSSLPVKDFDEFRELTQEINEMFISIREEINSRQTAEESQARLASLADAMPLIVYILSSEGKIIFCNKRFWDFLGLPPSDPQDIEWKEIAHPEDITMTKEAFRDARKTQSPCVCEIRAKNCEGKYNWFLVSLEPILNKDQELTHWYGTMVDIGEQRFIRDALQNAVRVRDEFLSIASHELKTPLTSLLLQTQMRKRYIEKGEVGRFTPEKLLVMKTADENQLKRLISLVDEMLDISRIRNGKLSINKTNFNFKELLLEVTARFEPQAQEKNTSLSIHCEKDYFVNWDRYRLQQVLENLITNAIKYGNGTPILIEVRDTENSLFFKVRDHGAGIDEKDIVRIFERFERATTANEVSGLGLGLYIVKQIITAHEGNISVKSHPGEGAEFTVEIPHRPI